MPDENPKSWTVVEQRPTTQVTPGGQFLDAMEVTIQTVSGVQFPITVPLNQYSAARVAAEAEMRAAEIEDVQAL